jgi:hypothetical protein
VQVPDYSEITVRFEGGDAALPVIGLVQEGPDTFLLQDGERIPVENPAHLAAPTGDYTLYLSAAENVQRQVDENGRTYFTFTVSGDRLARLVRDYLQANLPPGAPPNTQLSPSPYLQRISGSGELWLDDAGLPLRQVLQLTIPEASETYDANVRTITHFRFPDSSGEESLLPPPGAMLDTPPATASTAAAASTSAAGTTAVSPGPSPLNTAALASTLLLITAFALLVVVLLRYKVRRYVYASVVVSVILIMLASPFLQAVGWQLFNDQQAQALTLTEALGYGGETGTGISAPTAVSPAAANLMPHLNTVTSGCGSGESGVDTDGDGLDDLTETCLGTSPYAVDSDRDTITDTLEIEGFEFNGRTFHTNPLLVDSNNDNLIDAAEWPSPVGKAPCVFR